MKQTVRSPYATGEAEKLSKRIFRKQVLKFGEIDYHGRTVRFDKPYAEDVIQAFRENAFDTVPFVLADENNKHTRDPERARGEIIDLEATDSGLDAIISLNQSAASLVEENPKLGVSVSIKEQFQRADGQSWPRALAHVLGTFEPMLPGMSPWQTINASVEDEEVLDLTTINLSDKKKEKEMPPSKSKKYTEEEQDALFSKLEAFLASMESAEDDEDEDEPEDEVTETDSTDEDEDEDALSDEEIEELRSFLAEVDAARNQETVNASQGQDDARTVELSQTMKRQQQEISRLRAENDRRAFEQERAEIVQKHSIPPFIVDLARPLLEGQGRTVELSDSGKKVDAGEIVRKVFEAVGKQVTLLDLSGELGNNLDFSRDDEADHEDTLRKVKNVRAQMNI